MTNPALLNELVAIDRKSEVTGDPPAQGKWTRLLDRLHRDWSKTLWLLPWNTERLALYDNFTTTIEIYAALYDCDWRAETHPDTPGLNELRDSLRSKKTTRRHLLPIGIV